MSNERPKAGSQADAELEREIREGRKFSLADAIGRLAGPGMMKGTSPVTSLQQAETAIESYLNQNLRSGDGTLSAVVLRQVKQSDLLLANLDQPFIVLAALIERVLQSDYLLQELVRMADVEWGRTYGEKPVFEKEGTSAQADDPYTIASVRSSLTELHNQLTSSFSQLD